MAETSEKQTDIARCFEANAKAFFAKSELGVPYHYRQTSERAGWLEQAVAPSLIDLCVPAHKDDTDERPVVFHILNVELRKALHTLYPSGRVPPEDVREIVCYLGNEGDFATRPGIAQSDVDRIAADFARDLLAERFEE